jgi:hypothetical protein
MMPAPTNIKIESKGSGSIQYKPAAVAAITIKINSFLRTATFGLNQNSSIVMKE